jgi:O-antigen/teichoic acid export membrane protein
MCPGRRPHCNGRGCGPERWLIRRPAGAHYASRPRPGAHASSPADVPAEVPAVESQRPAVGSNGSGPAPAPSNLVGVGRHSLSRQAGTAFTIQTAGVGARYFGLALAARWMGATAFGAYAYALNLAQLIANPCDLGGTSSGLRFVPQYETEERYGLLRGVVRSLQLVPLVVGTVVAGASIAVIAVAGSGVVSFATSAIAMATIPLLILSDVQTAVTRGFHNIVGAFGPPMLLQPILVTAAVGIGFVGYGQLTAEQASWLTAVATAVVVLIQTGIVWRIARKRIPRDPRIYAPRKWARVSLPMLLTNTLQLVSQRLDVVMVGVFLGARSAGIYAVAFRTAGLSSSLQFAMNSTVAPRISAFHYGNRRDELQWTVARAVRWIFFPSLAITIGLALFGRTILSLFGHPFIAGWSALVVYSLGQLGSVSAGPVGLLLNLTGHHRKITVVTAVCAGITLAGYLTLIPALGMVGAAAANSVGVIIKNVWLRMIVRRRLGYRISVFHTPRPSA